MRRSSLVVLAIVVLAVAELVLLSAVGQAIGVAPLLLILAGEALLGGWLVRREGARAWASLQAAQRDPATMGPALSDAALVLVGALLLMLPGFISDAVGAVFLIPATRGVARRGVTGVFRALTRKYRDQADLLAAKTQRSTVVEGEAVDPPHPGRPADTVVRGEIED